ncbi:putative cytoplasmic protein [Streptococcus dysgalactiae subsp. dysgalactiae ATCC 27957]|nr:putative cytoplasmic protein [Streptococcus dysgalactiae subsp. dysgalactiae ATCC 27957]
MLEHKIDFMVTLEVKEANANGDPLNGNMPRTDAKGYGVMSDVSIKRKIRNRLQDMGKPIFVQANERIEIHKVLEGVPNVDGLTLHG